MVGRLRSFFALPLALLYIVEAALVGLFFVQAMRFLLGAFYARIGSASQQPALDPNLIDPTLPGLIAPATINTELTFLVYMLALPLVTLVIGRFRPLFLVAVGITAIGRYLMMPETDLEPTIAGSMVIGGGLLYIALLVYNRARIVPYLFIFGLALDQLYRAIGNTLDPTFSIDYTNTQVALSALVGILVLITFVGQQREINLNREESDVSADRGTMSIWGGIGLGGMLFLQMSLLSLPNAIAGRTESAYILIVPMLMVATLLPTIPLVRAQARQFIGLFDSSVRGWSWMLLIALLIVIGTRIQGIVAGVSLVLAQFVCSMVWWWFTRPRAQKERSFTVLWLILGILIFVVLFILDIFTYEYAFVRDFTGGFESLNTVIPPLLRGLRGLGLAVILMSVFLAVLPIVQTRRRIAWAGGSAGQSFFALLFVVGMTASVASVSQPPVVQGVFNPERIRVGTYNIHAGYNEFFHYDLEAIATTIQRSGANVVLIQEIEAGRLSSFGVDQPLWLARRLGMDRRFYPTIEGLQGLAVLSNIEIVFDEGTLLDSISSQTGLQRVQVLPDAGVITVYNTWLEPLLDVGGGQTSQELQDNQLAQLEQIFGIITADHPNGQLGRTIIGGTFNNIPDSDVVQRIGESGFIDHFAGDTLERSATYIRTGAQARFDYLWTTGNLQVAGRNVIDTNASDHRLVVLELQLRQPTP